MMFSYRGDWIILSILFDIPFKVDWKLRKRQHDDSTFDPQVITNELTSVGRRIESNKKTNNSKGIRLRFCIMMIYDNLILF